MRFRKSSKKANIVLSCALAFLLIFPLALNYLLFSSLNPGKMISNSPFFKAGKETVISEEKIGEDRQFSISEPNGVGTRIFSYTYTFNDPPERIKGLSIKTKTEGQLEKNILLEVSASGNLHNYGVKDAVLREGNEILFIINKANVSRMTVSCTLDVYADSAQQNDFFEIVEISVNTPAQSGAISSEYLRKAIIAFIVTSLIITLLAITVFSNVDDRLKRMPLPIEKRFLIAAFVMGLLFAVLLPVYQIPDESTHVTLMYKELNWNFDVHNDVGDFSDTLRILRNPDQKVNLQTYFNYSATLPVPQHLAVPSVQIIRHLPQAIPLVICTFLRVPSFIAFFLCELSALCFSVLVFYLALKIMPIKKEMFAFIILLPISIQQMGSLSYDATVTPLTFLLFAYILRLAYKKEYVTLKDMGFTLLLVCIIALIKIPYVLVAALWFIIPVKKYRLSFGRFVIDGEFIRRRKWLLAVLLAAIVAVGVFGIIRISRSNEYIRVMLAAITAPLGTARIMYRSFSQFFMLYVNQLVGSFGWFDTEQSSVFTLFMMVVLLLTTLGDDGRNGDGESAYSTSKIGRIFILLIGVAVCFTVQTSMFTWTLSAFGVEGYSELGIDQYRSYFSSLPYIGGAQGRYFLPAVPLLLLPFSFKRLKLLLKRINTRFALDAVYLVSFANIIVTLYGRYWT